MKFAHIADCHIGGWREERLNRLSLQAFQKAMDECKNVDFILISGDLFNTSLPSIDSLKQVVNKLGEMKKHNIPIYIIPGSHDFSPSGKTMLDVLEEADLVKNVVKGEVEDNQLRLKFTKDEKTGAKITGMLGKKGMLEKKYYENLKREDLENEEGFKIFMFHTALTELKTKEFEHMASSPLSFLPRNFDYYAGGHIHFVKDTNLEGYNNIVYPGPLFPNNFAELERLKNGGYYIYNDGELSYNPINIINVYTIQNNCDDMTPEEIENQLKDEISKVETFQDTIITLRLKGVLKSGKPTDLKLKEIVNLLYEKSAFFVMRNTSQLESQEFEAVSVSQSSVEEVEKKLIQEHLGKNKELNLEPEKEKELIENLMQNLSTEQHEGEKSYEYEERVKQLASKVLSGYNS